MGRLGYYSAAAPDRLHRWAFGVCLEDILLARHRWLDAKATSFLRRWPNAQVVELAAGLTSRGQRMVDAFPGVDWWETDLPGMISRKQSALKSVKGRTNRLHYEPIDAFASSGELSLERLIGTLSTHRPLLIVSEGLLNYFPTCTVEGLWRRLALMLSEFPAALYLSGVVGNECLQLPIVRPFRWGLALAARGGITLHYSDALECEAALDSCGFRSVQVAFPDARRVYRMIAATPQKLATFG